MTHPAHIVLNTPDLIAFWDFQDSGFTDRTPAKITLEPRGETPALECDGLFGPYSLPFEAVGIYPRHYLIASYDRAPQLYRSGADSAVSVLAWVKRRPTHYTGCELVAGIWNEHLQRQYALFLNLAVRKTHQQVGAHVSRYGGATEGFPYCMDVAIGATEVSLEQWHLIAMTYNGQEARAYLDGKLDRFQPAEGAPPYGSNPFPYPGGLHFSKADFSVGATARPDGVKRDVEGRFVDVGSSVGNPFVGLLGGLAVFARALTEGEISALAAIARKESPAV